MSKLTFTYAIQYRLLDYHDNYIESWSSEYHQDFDQVQPLGDNGNASRINKLVSIWENTFDSNGDYLGIRIFDSMMLDRPKLFYCRYPECFKDAPAKLSEYGLIELAMSVLHELHALGVDQAEPVSQFRL